MNSDSEPDYMIFISDKTLATSKIFQSQDSIKMEEMKYLDVDFKIVGISSQKDKMAIYGKKDCYIAKVNIGLNLNIGKYFFILYLEI